MVDSGIGYPQSLQSAIQTPIIIVDGDGMDTDGDGQADSRVNPDRIHFGQNGEVYLEQQFEIIEFINIPFFNYTGDNRLCKRRTGRATTGLFF